MSVRYKVLAEAQERAHAATHSSSAKTGETITAAPIATAIASSAAAGAAGGGSGSGGGGDMSVAGSSESDAAASAAAAAAAAAEVLRPACEHNWSGVERNRVTNAYTKECMLCSFKIECKSDGSLL